MLTDKKNMFNFRLKEAKHFMMKNVELNIL